MPRTGRPRKYEHPVRLVVWLEARELKQLDATAKAAGAPMTSGWARQVLVETAAREGEAFYTATASHERRRTPRGRPRAARHPRGS